MRTNIFNLLQPIQGLESFSSSSSLETNAEFEYMLSMISSQTKSVELSGGKVCTSSVEGTCRGGSNILDKDKSTRWSSLWKNNQYVSFRVPEQDLCASISQIGIIWETASATEYSIEISTDGTNWTEIGHYKAERKNWKVHTDLISLPYPICCVPLWRINCISRATKYGFSIYEIVLIKSQSNDIKAINTNSKNRERKCKRLLKALKVLGSKIETPLLPCETAKDASWDNDPRVQEPRRRVKNRPYVVWPAPSKKFEHGKRTASFQLNSLQIVGVDGRKPKLQQFIQVWKGYMKRQPAISIASRPHEKTAKPTSKLVITILSTTKKSDSNEFFETTESYKLSIPSKSTEKIQLQSYSAIGILRGLTTLMQLSQRFEYHNGGSESAKCTGKSAYCYEIQGVPIFISDEPYLKYRGLLIDSARVFITVHEMMSIIDTMFLMKLNVLHWHLSDDVHFALQLMWKRNQPLWRKGACSVNEVYKKGDIQVLVDYARDRGILIIPELDLPGHALSWSKSFPDLLATKECGTWGVPVDVTKDSTYGIIKSVYLEIYDWFSLDKAKFLHLGGDEVKEDCWKEDPDIQKRASDLDVPIYGLKSYFFFNAINLVVKYVDENLNTIIWQESAIPLLNVYDENKNIWPTKKKFFLHVWKTKDWEQQVGNIRARNEENRESKFKIIMSKGWYLNDDSEEQCKTFKQCYRRNDDLVVEEDGKSEDVNDVDVEFSSDRSRKLRNGNFEVFGGEIGMWEFHPEMLPKAYKRIAAISDRMWNKKFRTQIKDVLRKEKEADEFISFVNSI